MRTFCGVLVLVLFAACSPSAAKTASTTTTVTAANVLDRVPKTPAPAEASPCAPDDVGDCQRRCDAGGTESCYRLGRIYSSGIKLAPDPARAFAIFRRTCEAGGGNACNAWAVSYRDGDTVVVKDEAIAVVLLERACELGSTKGCVNSGALLHFAGSLPRDLPRARRLYERGCAGTDSAAAMSCRNLGQLLRGSDPSSASSWFQKACALGDSQGCELAPPSPAAANASTAANIALSEQRCHAGDGAKCSALGFAYRTGEGVAVDEATAIAWFAKACELGYPEGCQYWGAALRSTDPKKAMEVLQKGCAQRPGINFPYPAEDCCFQAIELLEAGIGVTKDVDKALEQYEQLCREAHTGRGARSIVACRKATTLWKARGAAGVARAKELVEFGCGLGDKQACAQR